MPKIISIGKYLFKLQLKMSGVFFETHCRSTDSWLDGIDIGNNFGPALHLLFQMHEIWTVDSQENY